MGVLWGQEGEEGGKKVKNLAIKYAKCRKLDYLMVEETQDGTYAGGPQTHCWRAMVPCLASNWLNLFPTTPKGKIPENGISPLDSDAR